MKRHVILNGEIVDSPPLQFDSIEQVEPGVYSALYQQRVFEIRIIPDGPGWTVETGGRAYHIELRDPRDASGAMQAAGGSGLQKIAASMPGKVVRILVQPGDSVEAGQGLIVIEAMKMQNEMKALRAGIVVDVKAKEGDTVAAGHVLVTIE